MTAAFNPYQEWLELPTAGGPPNYYQLLGLDEFAGESQVIATAADRAMSRVRSCRPGPHAAEWARLLDEIAAAKNCLTDAQSKADYDRRLRDQLPAGGAEDSGRAAASSAPANPALYPPTALTPPDNAADTANTRAVVDAPQVAYPAGPAEPWEEQATRSPSAFPPAPTTAPPGAVPYLQPVDGATATPAGAPNPMAPVTPGVPTGAPTPAANPMAPVAQAAPLAPAPGGVDPMAPHPPSQNPMSPMAPVSALPAGQAWQAGNPMAPVAPSEPASSQPTAVPMAKLIDPGPQTAVPVAQPWGQPATPLQAAPQAGASKPQGAELLDGSPAVPAPPSATAMAAARARTSVLVPIMAGTVVGLSLLLVGGLYHILNRVDDRAGEAVSLVAESPEPEPAPAPRDGGLPEPDRAAPSPPPATVPDRDVFEPPVPFDDSPPLVVAPPEMPDETPPPPEMPDQPPPAAPKVTREQLVQLGEEMTAARAALGDYDFAAAERHLQAAEPLAVLEAHQAKLARLRQVTQHLRDFYGAIQQGMAKLGAGEVLEIGEVQAAVVESSTNRIVLRVAGRNSPYALNELPLGLAVALAHQQVSPDDPLTVLGKAAYVATSRQSEEPHLQKARGWFQQAAAELPEAQGLVAFLDDQYDLAADLPDAAAPSPPVATTPPQQPPARDEVVKLAAALEAARASIRAGEFEAAENRLAEAEPWAKLDIHKQKLARLRRWSQQAREFGQALRQAVAELEPGEVLKIGTSTEVEVVRVSDDEIEVKVKVADVNKTFPLDKPPLGLALSLAQRKLSTDEATAKAMYASFLLARADAGDAELAQARRYYEEAGEAQPELAGLSAVVDDDYDLLEDL